MDTSRDDIVFSRKDNVSSGEGSPTQAMQMLERLLHELAGEHHELVKPQPINAEPLPPQCLHERGPVSKRHLQLWRSMTSQQLVDIMGMHTGDSTNLTRPGGIKSEMRIQGATAELSAEVQRRALAALHTFGCSCGRMSASLSAKASCVTIDTVSTPDVLPGASLRRKR